MSRSRPQFPRSTHGTPGTMTPVLETKTVAFSDSGVPYTEARVIKENLSLSVLKARAGIETEMFPRAGNKDRTLMFRFKNSISIRFFTGSSKKDSGVLYKGKIKAMGFFLKKGKTEKVLFF